MNRFKWFFLLVKNNLFYFFLGGAGIFALNYLISYYLLFSAYPFIDDVGCIAINLRDFARGSKLYDEIPGMYGPLHYFWQAGIHQVFAIPIDSDGVRTVGLFHWCLGSLAAAIYLWRMTHHVVFALIGYIIFHGFNVCLVPEVGHPQAFIFFLQILALIIATLPSERYHRAQAISWGIIAASLIMMKINIGIFFLGSLAIYFAAYYRQGFFRFMAGFCLIGLILFPFLLMKPRLQETWALYYSFIQSISLLPLALLSLFGKGKPPTYQVKDLVWFFSCFTLGLGLCVFFTLVSGSSFQGILEGLFFQHLKNTFYLAAPFTLKQINFAGSSLVCFFIVFVQVKKTFPRWLINNVFLIGKTYVATLGAFFFLVENPENLFLYYACFSWVLAIKEGIPTKAPVQEKVIQMEPNRLFLASIATMNNLIAYPTAGTQVYFSVSFVILMAMVCLADCWKQNPRLFLWGGLLAILSLVIFWRLPFGPFFKFWPLVLGIPAGAYYIFLDHKKHGPYFLSKALVSLVGIIGFLGLFFFTFEKAKSLEKHHQALTSLELHGASKLRLSQEEVAVYRWTVHNVKANMDSFVSIPGLYSLNLLSDIESPNKKNISTWFIFFPADEQEAIFRGILEKEAGVVYSPLLLDRWLVGIKSPKVPILDRLKSTHRSLGHIGLFEILVSQNLKEGHKVPGLVYSAFLLEPSIWKKGPLMRSEILQKRKTGEYFVELCLPTLDQGPVYSLEVINVSENKVGVISSSDKGFEQGGISLWEDKEVNIPLNSLFPLECTQANRLTLQCFSRGQLNFPGLQAVRLFNKEGKIIAIIPFVYPSKLFTPITNP